MTLSDFSVFREHCRAVIDTCDLSDEDEDEDIENNLVI